jgi:tetratricopeptide (TPR) repeat protein
MDSLAELVERTSTALADSHQVDAGLVRVVRALEQPKLPSEAIEAAIELLGARVRAVTAARKDLRRLLAQLTHLATVLPFTAEGWPERKAELEALLRSDSVEGLAAWLDSWFAALAGCRMPALERLVKDIELPPGAQLLVERCSLAVAALTARSWSLAEPMLAAGIKGQRVGDQAVPSPDVRTDLALLLTRLALDQHLPEAAERTLAHVDAGAAVEALRARTFFLRGDRAAAREHLERGSALDPTDLDVSVATIEEANADGQPTLALDAARMAVDSVLSVEDMGDSLVRLIVAPAELWTALAERALEEADWTSYDAAVQVANGYATNDELQAVLAELNVEMTVARGLSIDDQVAALADAGTYRLLSGQIEQAREALEKAWRLKPDDAEAALRLGDCLIFLDVGAPLAQARKNVERALALLLDVQRRGGITPDNSWSYLSEAAGRVRLAESASADDIRDEQWRAMLAVCRAIAHRPELPERWEDLARAGASLDLYRVPQIAATHALELGPERPSAIAHLVMRLANSGQLEEALERLGGGGEVWEQAVRGFVLLRTGDPWETVRLLRTSTLDPAWSWASETLITALLLTDRYDEAVTEAKKMKEHWGSRLDEYAGRVSTAWAGVVMGELDEAEKLMEPLAAGDPRTAEPFEIRGKARLLQGRSEEGLADLETLLRGTRTVLGLDDLSSILVPRLEVLAAHRGVTLPKFDSLESLRDARRAELEAQQDDPVTELANAPVAGADPAIAELARSAAGSLVSFAQGRPDVACAVLQPAVATHPGDREIGGLAILYQRHDAARRVILAADATVAPELRTLLDDDPTEAGHALVAQARGDLATLTRLANLLREGAFSNERHEPAAVALGIVDQAVRAAGGGDYAAPPSELGLIVPPSWFAMHDDPLTHHPLFLRYIPEMRVRAGWMVPGVNVSTLDSLEPDGYQIMVFDEVVESGHLDQGAAYAQPATLELLDPELRQLADQDAELGLLRLPATTVTETGGLSQLLTMDPLDVLARRIGACVEEHAEKLRPREADQSAPTA